VVVAPSKEIEDKVRPAIETIIGKKVTDDDLAALEAQKMMQSGSKRRSKPTRRK